MYEGGRLYLLSAMSIMLDIFMEDLYKMTRSQKKQEEKCYRI